MSKDYTMSAFGKNKCLQCGNTTYERWSNKRTRSLERFCKGEPDEWGHCDYVSAPYTPPRRRVKTTRRVCEIHNRGGWEYEAFDGYGHIMTSSQTFPSKKAALKEALEDIQRATDLGTYGGVCKAVVWSPYGMRGTLVVAKKYPKLSSA